MVIFKILTLQLYNPQPLSGSVVPSTGAQQDTVPPCLNTEHCKCSPVPADQHRYHFHTLNVHTHTSQKKFAQNPKTRI